VEDRIHELSEIFVVAIWGYAVMSNHLHVVVQTLPEAVATWSDLEVASRWTRLFSRQDLDAGIRSEVLAGSPERIKTLRCRLSDLSWFMRCLSLAQAKVISKSDLVTPQSGQVEVSGTSSQRVPAAMPSSGSPSASS